MICPKCNGELKKQNVEHVEVDQCEACSGIWFDYGELQQVLAKDLQEHLENKIDNNDGHDAIRATCPKCGGNGKMIDVVEPKYGLRIDTCKVCYGQWLDGGEYEKLKGKSFFDIFKI